MHQAGVGGAERYHGWLNRRFESFDAVAAYTVGRVQGCKANLSADVVKCGALLNYPIFVLLQRLEDNMIFIGIDPGKTGGIAALNDGNIIELHQMPLVNEEVSASLLSKILSNLSSKDRVFTVIERVHSMPRDGHSGAFRFGVSYGTIRATVECLGLSYALVTPQSWQKAMHLGTRLQEDKKARSFEKVSQLWPQQIQQFFSSSRCKKPHSGMVESALIARYYWEQNTSS